MQTTSLLFCTVAKGYFPLSTSASVTEDNIATQLHKQATDGDEQGTTPATESAAFSAHKTAVTEGAAGGPTADTPPSEQADNAVSNCIGLHHPT